MSEFSKYSSLFSLRDKNIVLTGAAGRLGSSMAWGLASAGAHVWLAGRNEGNLRNLQGAICAAGGQASVAVVDLRDDSSVHSFTRMLGDNLQALHGLVNNAYGGETGTIETTTALQFADAYRVSVIASAELVRQLLPLIKNAASNDGDAAVLNVCSMYGMVSPDQSIYGDSGMNSPPHYGAAKGGLIQYTRYAACHLAPFGVRVNAISPGPFPPDSFKETKPEFHDALAGKVPLKRIGHPDELAGAVIFLCSPASSYVTGINLPIDGGWTAW
jgi:NAD(P)-dependent dehydrogenase (short-subunit alcohol dehydrogenase family)